jgi:hypothetical protein
MYNVLTGIKNTDDFFEWLVENGNLDNYEAALELAEDVIIPIQKRLEYGAELDKYVNEYRAIQTWRKRS